MKKVVQFVLAVAVFASPSWAHAQTGSTGAQPAATGFKSGLSRLRCTVFNRRRLTVVQGDKREFNFPEAISGLSKNPSVARASIGFGTLTVEGVALGKTQIVVLGGRQERQIIEVQVVATMAQAGEQAREDKVSAARRKACVAADAKSSSVATSKLPAAGVPEVTPPSRSSLSDLSGPSNGGKLGREPDTVSSLPTESRSVEQQRQPPDAHSTLPPGLMNTGQQMSGPDSRPLLAVPVGDTVTLVELTSVTVPVENVTAAYSLDPLNAEAQSAGDQVRIWGRVPGQGLIVLVHNDFSTSTLHVIVTQAPPILPDSTWTGLNSAEGRGYYESRVSSNPLQISQLLDYRAGRMQLHLANAILPSANLPGVSTTWFPFSFFRYDADHWRLTLLDEQVNSSPISVDATILRGVHFATGGLSIHAGYSSIAGFQSLFLPVRKQLIAGASFAHHLSTDVQVGVTGYYIERDAFALDPHAATGVATLFLRKHSLQGLSYAAEVGVSKGIGGAASADRDTGGNQLHMAARYRPRGYAAPDVDNLTGLQSDARWSHSWSARFASDFSGTANHLYTRPGSQTSEVGAGNFRYRPSRRIVVSSGFTASRFSSTLALFPEVHRYSLPVGISYDRPQFGAFAQYEYSQTSRAFSPGAAYRGSLRWSRAHFQASANAGLDTQALGIDSVFSAFPGLNAELASLGFGAATSVEQLAALLSDRAFLNSLGIAPGATLQLVPRNWHGGLNLSWRSAHQTLEFNSNYNQNSFLARQNSTALETVRYRRGLTNATEVIASISVFEISSPARQVTPIWEVGLRHRFGGNPLSRFHHRDEGIAGTVRLQDSSGTTLVRGAEITLDGERKTKSDNEGHYQFARVQAGVHSVQIAFKSARPFYYTTPSKVSTRSGSVVDFGVIYPSAQVVGYVLSDAGVGLPGIGILVKGPQGEQNLTTDKAGQFFVPVAQAGDYVATVSSETVPDGYVLEDLLPAEVSVGAGEFKKVSFKLPAIRALTGVVQAYDPAKAAYVALKDVTIVLPQLNRSTTTDGRGWYSFRNMPTGTFTIQVEEKPFTKVSFGVGPQLLRQDIRLNSDEVSVSRR